MFFLAILACAPDLQCPVGFVEADDTASRAQCVFDEASILALVRTFDDGELIKVNAEPYMPPLSATPIRRNTWVSPVAVECAEDLTAPELFLSIDQDDWSHDLDHDFPVGTVIIHEAVDGEEAHGVEVKRSDYEDDLGRDWWLRMVTSNGVIEEPAQYGQACSSCHNESTRPSEGLWGVPEFAK